MQFLLAAAIALALAFSGLVVTLRSLDYLEKRPLENRYESQGKTSVPSATEGP